MLNSEKLSNLFLEVSSRLSFDELELLKSRGMMAFQPGIESLSDELLRLMGKGVTALENIRFFKGFRQPQNQTRLEYALWNPRRE